tara:strand:+ start:206 stop:811 length:606 start_codon:yes stop_codon:yes gene_type:complete
MRQKRSRAKALKGDPTAAKAAAEQLVQAAPAQQRSSPLNGPMPSMGGGFDKIVEHVFELDDPEQVFGQLVEKLKIHDALTPGALQMALNQAEDTARLAHQLFVGTKVDFARFEIDCAEVYAALRDGATAELQAEKDAGERSKAITKDDVTGRVATMYPDEYREISERKAKAEATLEHMKRLAELWQSRCYSVSNMLSAGRR